MVVVVVVVAVVVHGDGGHVGDGGEAASIGTAILAGVTSPETAFELFQARQGAVDPPASQHAMKRKKKEKRYFNITDIMTTLNASAFKKCVCKISINYFEYGKIRYYMDVV